jgi:hypothetical protein
MPYAKPDPGKPILVDIGGRQLELRYSLKTLKELDADHNISVLKGESMGQAFQNPALMAVVLYYGLRAKNADISQDWVEDNVDASMLLDLAPLLAYATTGRWPDLAKFLGESPNAERPSGTGSPSGPSGDSTSAAVN